MAEPVGAESDGIETIRIELSEIRTSRRSSFQNHASGVLASFRSASSISARDDANNDENNQQWAEIERLPTFKRLRSSLFEDKDGTKGDNRQKKVVDLSKLAATDRHLFIEKLIKHIEHDNLKLLRNIRKRIDK